MTRPADELPDYLTQTDLDSLIDEHPVAPTKDSDIAQDFLNQWSACRYATGSQDVPLEDRYTGPAWSLLSDDLLLRAIPDEEGRTAEALVRQFRPLVGNPSRNAYPDQVVDVRSFPADAHGQTRLLVFHRDRSLADSLQVSLIVDEGGTWRLDDYAWTTAVAGPGTPSAGEADAAHLIQIAVDVASPASTVLEGQVIAGVPISMVLNNPGSSDVSVRIGDQDLGVIAPGQTLRIVPFIVPDPSVPDSQGRTGITLTTTNEMGQDIETTWPVSPRR